MEKRKLIVCAALCLVMATGAWAGITDGLISHWSFNEGAGLVAGDSAGGNTGTLMGGTSWTAGKFGSGLDFDGIDGYVDAGNDASLMPANVTVSAWIKVDGYGYYGQIAGMATDTGTAESGYSLLADDYWISGSTDSVSMWLSGGPDVDGSYLANTGVPAPPTDWVHVAGTYDGTTTTVYVNGVGISGTDESGDIDYTHVTSFYIGLYWTPIGGGYTEWYLPFVGQMDDVAVWDRALSVNEVGMIASGMEIPEPATMLLLGFGAFALIRRKK